MSEWEPSPDKHSVPPSSFARTFISTQTVMNNRNQEFSYFGLRGFVLLKFHFLTLSCDSDGSGGALTQQPNGWQEQAFFSISENMTVNFSHLQGRPMASVPCLRSSTNLRRQVLPQSSLSHQKGGWIPRSLRRINCSLKPEGAYASSITWCLIWRQLENLGRTSSSHLRGGIWRSRFL